MLYWIIISIEYKVDSERVLSVSNRNDVALQIGTTLSRNIMCIKKSITRYKNRGYINNNLLKVKAWRLCSTDEVVSIPGKSDGYKVWCYCRCMARPNCCYRLWSWNIVLIHSNNASRQVVYSVQSRRIWRLAMRSWFLSLLEIVVVVSKWLVVFITVSNCRYKLSGNLYREGKRWICSLQNKRRDIPWLCCNLTDWVFYTGTKNDCFLQ